MNINFLFFAFYIHVLSSLTTCSIARVGFVNDKLLGRVYFNI